MKTIALLLALCGSVTTPTEKNTCIACRGRGWNGCMVRVVPGHWFSVPGIRVCGECDGYRREVTLYGRLLKDLK